MEHERGIPVQFICQYFMGIFALLIYAILENLRALILWKTSASLFVRNLLERSRSQKGQK